MIVEGFELLGDLLGLLVVELSRQRRARRAAPGPSCRGRARRQSGASWRPTGARARRRAAPSRSGGGGGPCTARRTSRTSAGRWARGWPVHRARRSRPAAGRRARGRRRRLRTSVRARAAGRCPRGRSRPWRDRARRRRSTWPAGRAGLQGFHEAVQAGAQHADQPLGLIQLLVRLGLHALAGCAADARARGGHDVERPLMLARRVLVVALGDRLGQLGQLGRDTPAARDQQIAPVGDVGDAVTPAIATGAQPHECEDEDGRSDRDEQPYQCSSAGTGAGGRGGGKGAGRERGGAEGTGSGGASAGGAWGRPLGGHGRSVGASRGGLVLLVRDLKRSARTAQFLIMRHSCFRLR